MTKVALLSLAMLVLVFSLPVSAAANGAIQGSVTNGTTGGGATAGLEVILYVFQGSEEQEQRSEMTDDQGRFRFDGLETGSDWVYRVRVTYRDVAYAQGLLSFQAGQNDLSIEIPVYETTTDGGDIGVERAHILITASASGLSVAELYVFENPTDRTYIGAEQHQGRRWTARFSLPEGSYDLDLNDGSLGGRFLSTEDGFVDTEPHWPGSTQVLFAYAVDCPSGECDLAREVLHPVSNLDVLLGDTGATVESSQLVLQGKQDAQGQAYLNYVAHGLMPGQHLDLRVRLSGTTPAPGTPGKSSAQALPWIVLGMVVIALVLVYPFWRQRIETAARKGE